MRSVLFFLTLCLGISSNALARPSCDEGTSQELSPVLRSVVAVINQGGRGSGVAIGPNDVLVAAHTVDNRKHPVLMVTCAWQDIFGQVVWVDSALDLALVRTETALADFLPMRNRPSLPKNGDAVRTISHPGTDAWAVSEGVVRDARKRVEAIAAQTTLIFSSAESDRGSSGGALVDADGYLVGIIVAGQKIYSSGVAWWQRKKLTYSQSIANFCAAYAHSQCQAARSG